MNIVAYATLLLNSCIVQFVHGLGDDYRSWGVTSTVDTDKLCENDATCAEMWPSYCDDKLVPTLEMLLLQKKNVQMN